MSAPSPADPSLCDPDKLVDLARSGDRDALARMTRCYGARLMAVGRAHCRDAEGARDAVQDALLAAAEHLDDFRGDGSLEGWLVRMVARACYRMKRGRKNDPKLHVEVDGERDAGDEDEPEVVAAQAELAANLDSALDQLEPVDRALILLADVDGWKGPELAEKMGMTPGQVRTRLSRARRRLRDQLAPVWREWSGDSTIFADD